MIDLFRYIEQSYVVPSANLNAIEVRVDSSDFQNKLRNDLQSNSFDSTNIRKEVENFIEENSLQSTNSSSLRQQYLDFHDTLLGLSNVSTGDLENVIEQIFGSQIGDLVSSDAFKDDKRLLNDLIIAVKMVTGFDKVRTNDLVAMRRAVAFIEEMTSRNCHTYSVGEIKAKLNRPIVIPSAFLKKQSPKTPPVTLPTGDSDEVIKRKALQKEYDSLRAAYDTLMSLRPDELRMATVNEPQDAAVAAPTVRAFASQPISDLAKEAPQQVLALTSATIRKLDPSVMSMFSNQSIEVAKSDVATLVDQVRKELVIASGKLNPCGFIETKARVYTVGTNTFAIKHNPVIKSDPATPSGAPATTLDFSHAITKPIGIGNLQVVRQELIGYEAKEISHIENILQGEILRHSTTRSETNEITLTEETQTTQTDERDLQSTIRNELASETQKESGQQSSSAQDRTSTSSYGKLVENNKTNYAKTVTDRAVSNLSQQVKRQRIQREQKTFVEKSVHEFDNSKTGAKNVTGIYQWVDKKYKTRVINYGTRLLYDVVVPEPAAFFIESIKNTPQPEGLDLIKPDVFDLCPSCLTAENYACLAAKYGVSGSVTPPPDDFLKTVAYTTSPEPKIDVTFNPANYSYLAAFSIDIPEGYKAISGYVQRVNFKPSSGSSEERTFEVYIGEFYFLRFAPGALEYLNHSFPMKGEAGKIPVTFRSFDKVYRFNFAIGINCQRTDKAYEQWQLKAHAVIMAGYQRQLADYQDKLNKYLAVARAQMALAQNFSRDRSVEEQELKRVFLTLLMGEHPEAAIPAPDPNFTPFSNPSYVRDWGALVAFFERAFEWENIMYTYYPYFWGRIARWGELILIQDIDPQFEAFLKAGAARVVIPVRPGFEAALAHYHETGQIWMGKEMPDVFSDQYVSIIQEIKARNFAPGDEVCVEEWDVTLPTTLVKLKDDATLPQWEPSSKLNPPSNA